MIELPSELVLEILRLLDVRDLRAAACVCRRLALLASDDSLWRSLCARQECVAAVHFHDPAWPRHVAVIPWRQHVLGLQRLVRKAPFLATACTYPTSMLHQETRESMADLLRIYLQLLQRQRMASTFTSSTVQPTSQLQPPQQLPQQPPQQPQLQPPQQPPRERYTSSVLLVELDATPVDSSASLETCDVASELPISVERRTFSSVLDSLSDAERWDEAAAWSLLEHAGASVHRSLLRRLFRSAIETGCVWLMHLIARALGDDLELNDDSRHAWYIGERVPSLRVVRHMLSMAIAVRQPAPFRLLLELGASPHLVEEPRRSGVPLVCVAAMADASFVRFLLLRHQCDVLARDNAGSTLLHYAALFANAPLLRYLCREPAHSLFSASSAAASTTSTTMTIAEYIVGARLERLVNRQKENPLHMLLRSPRYCGDREASLEELVALRLAPLENAPPESVAAAASRRSSKASRSAQVLLNAADHAGYTPMHLALRWAPLSLLRRLHEFGCSLSVRNSLSRNSVLHIAIHYGRTAPILDTLLRLVESDAERRALLDSTNVHNKTPLYMAASRYQPDNVALLLSYRPRSLEIPSTLRWNPASREIAVYINEAKGS